MRRVLSLVVLLAACIGPVAADAPGAEIYAQVCARCHGEALDGGIGPALGSGSPLDGRPADYIEGVVSRGRGSMPAFGSTLTPEQMERLVAFLLEAHGS